MNHTPKSSYDYQDLLASGRNELFGPGNAQLPAPPMLMLDRITQIDLDGGAHKRGHIVAASDVYPEEPLPADHPVRSLKGFVRSAHRASALDSAFKKMGEMVLEDMALMDRGLPPMRCKRAERETVSRMRSKPVSVN